MGSVVRVKEAIVITPAEPTPSTVLSLSALDSQLFLRFTIEYLLVYELPSPRRTASAEYRSSISSRIKSALAKALVPYYPLAGRVRPRSSGPGLEVVCRSQGAVFLEALSDHVIQDFEGAPRHVNQWRKLLSLFVADVLKGAPPLVVQLTWLRDGNAVVAVGINHCVCDGIGSSEFLNSFAELTGRGPGVELRPKPVWDRHLVDSVGASKNGTGVSPAAPPEYNRVQDLCGFAARFSSERLVPTSVVFDRTSIDELKKVSSSPQPGSTFTSFEVLSAHIWRSWARSMNLPSNQMLKLIFSVNIRSRVKPGLPTGYYGNAFVLGCAQASVRDLTEKGLGHVSKLVKAAKDRVDADYVQTVVDSVRQSKTGPDLGGTLVLSQWSRLGLERIDFGMGKPVQIASVCCDRYCLLLPVADRKDVVKVMVAVPASAVTKYENLVRSPYL